MNWIKTSIIVFSISIALLVVSDNIIYSFSGNKEAEKKTISFRHESYQDYIASPSSHYISISNASLSDSPQRFRTGKYGEVLYDVYDKKSYAKNCKYVFIGGSSTEARWVDEKLRWVALVDKIIGGKDPNSIAFNFGVGGQNLAQSLNRYNSFISELKPSFVFVMHEANDISKFLKGGYSVVEGSLHNLYDRKRLFDSMLSRVRSILVNLLPYASHQWRKYRNKSYIPLRSASPLGFGGLNAKEAAIEYSGRLLALNELVAADGGTLILIEYPEMYEEVLLGNANSFNHSVNAHFKSGLANNSISEADFIKFLKEFRRSLQVLVEKSNIPLIKTEEVFDIRDFYDSIHFNEAGSSKFAQFLQNQLVNFNCQGS